MVTELPYATRKSTILEAIGKKVRDGKLVGVADVRDESDHTGIRVVIEILREHGPTTVLADLLQQTPLRSTFGGIMLALVPTGEGHETYPEYLSLKQCLVHFIQHRLNVVERRSRHERQKREERLHIVTGLLVALNAIDDAVGIIKKSSDREAARANLQKRLRLTEQQAAAIVVMPLGNLASLEIQKLEAEAKELAARIKALMRLIESERARLGVVGEETAELKKQYARPRRTLIMDGAEMADETMTATDLMGSQIVSLYRDGIELRDAVGFNDRASAGLTSRRSPTPIGRWYAKPAWRVCAVSSQGDVWHCPVSQVNGSCNGKSVVGGGVIASSEAYLVLLTKKGQIKRTKVTDLPRSVGAWSRVIGLEKGDEVLYAGVERGETEIMLFTRMGQAIRMKTAETNPQASSSAKGVTGMKVGQGDALIAAGLLAPGSATHVVVVSENGYGKKVPLAEWPLQGRGGKGVQALNITPATGKVATAVPVHHGDSYVDLVTQDGRRQRLNMADIPEDNRRNRGAKLVDKAAGALWAL